MAQFKGVLCAQTELYQSSSYFKGGKLRPEGKVSVVVNPSQV